MANTKTALDSVFFWHQFKAGPWPRILLIPVGLAFIVGGAWVGTWLAVIGGALIGTSTLIIVVYPEQDAFRAFGMNAARARQQLLIVAVPIVVFAVTMYAVFVPRPIIALAGSLTSLVIGAIFVVDHGAVGDQDYAVGMTGRRIRDRGTLPFQAIWRKTLISSVAIGLALAIAVAASGFIANEMLASFIASAPVLVFFGWFGQQVFQGGVSPLVAKSFGLPRSQWATHVVGVSAASGVLVGTIAGGVSMLLPLNNPDISWHPFIAIAVAVSGFSVFTAGTSVRGKRFSWIVAFLLWFGVRDILRFEEATIMGPLSIGVLAVSAVVALIGVVCLALYVEGSTNITSANMQRIAGLNNSQ